MILEIHCIRVDSPFGFDPDDNLLTESSCSTEHDMAGDREGQHMPLGKTGAH